MRAGGCIVSSVSDFIGLHSGIQEAGVLVYGFGMRPVFDALVAACGEWVLLDEPALQVISGAEPACCIYLSNIDG